jgi:hypothetical protein
LKAAPVSTPHEDAEDQGQADRDRREVGGATAMPALVGEDGGLIAGHARVLADNQLAITGSGWDPELLRLELGELKLGGFDLSLTGFGDLELKDLLAERTEGLTPTSGGALPMRRSSANVFLGKVGSDSGRILFPGVRPAVTVNTPKS